LADGIAGQGAENNENLLDLLTAVMPFCHVPAAEGIPLFLRNSPCSRKARPSPRSRRQ